MSSRSAAWNAPPAPVSWRQVALPVEHGGWGLLGQPLVLGLLLAPTGAGAALAVAGLFAFLARHPLKIALADRRRGARHPRTAAADRVAALYAAGALSALAFATPHLPLAAWLVIAAAAPLAVVQLGYDVRLQGRALWTEMAGAAAFGAGAAVILLAGRWPARAALAAWALLALKAATSILYVRARLRLERGLEVDTVGPVAGHFVALLAAALMAAAALAPWSAALAFAVLLARATRGLSPFRSPCRAQVVGIQELAYGAGAILALAAGWALGA